MAVGQEGQSPSLFMLSVSPRFTPTLSYLTMHAWSTPPPPLPPLVTSCLIKTFRRFWEEPFRLINIHTKTVYEERCCCQSVQHDVWQAGWVEDIVITQQNRRCLKVYITLACKQIVSFNIIALFVAGPGLDKVEVWCTQLKNPFLFPRRASSPSPTGDRAQPTGRAGPGQCSNVRI